MSYDLAQLDGYNEALEQGAEVALKHPATDEPLGIVWVVASYDSERVKRVQRRQIDAALKARARNKAPTSEMTENNMRDIVVAATLSWTGQEYKGETLECTPANVRMLVTQYPWIIDQVDAVAADKAAYFRRGG